MRGTVYLAKGDEEAALRDYSHAIELLPNNPLAFAYRAQLLMKRSQKSAAIADLRRYLDLGGGKKNGDTEQVERLIRKLR
jgi:Tfp pilus assembly protein PilF